MSRVRALAAGLSAGLPLDRALDVSGIALDPAREVVKSIVDFSRETGVPRAVALAALADSIDEAARRERAISTGSATATQTSRILIFLPAATAIGAEVFGFNVVATLMTTPVGWGCVIVGVGLNVVAAGWMKRIRSSVPRPPLNTGLVLDLAAAVSQSSGLTQRHVEQLALYAREWQTDVELAHIERYRALSRETGIPISGLLLTDASLIRLTARTDVEHALELLPGRLLGPVGVCLFPAFIATTVIPVVVSMVTQFVR